MVSETPFSVAGHPDLITPERRRAQRCASRMPCWLLVDDALLTARLLDVSATGAYLKTAADIPLGTRIVLRHASAGQIDARVVRRGDDGIGIAFDLGENSVGFTLRAVTAEMTQQPLSSH